MAAATTFRALRDKGLPLHHSQQSSSISRSRVGGLHSQKYCPPKLFSRPFAVDYGHHAAVCEKYRPEHPEIRQRLGRHSPPCNTETLLRVVVAATRVWLAAARPAAQFAAAYCPEVPWYRAPSRATRPQRSSELEVQIAPCEPQ